jgi:hypothetical protein
MSVTVSNIRRCNWDVTWNAVPLGGVDEVDPDMELLTEPITVGSIGKVELGSRYIGLNALIKVQLREVTRTAMEKLLPWFAGSPGAAINLAPAINVDLYTYAQTLLLHPTSGASGTTEDLNFPKAVPMQSMKLKRDGENDDVWDIIFKIFPDRSQLPALVYGTMTA